MGRTLAAFLIAPLWVPLATGAYTPWMFPYHEQRLWVYITIIIAAIFGYGGTLALGLPTLLILRRLGRDRFWLAPIAGFSAGVVTGIVFLILFGLSLGESFSLVMHNMRGHVDRPFGLLIPGLLGMCVGTTFWLIARPDRNRQTKSQIQTSALPP